MRLKSREVDLPTPCGERLRGRILKGYTALLVDGEECIVLARGYRLYKYNPATGEAVLFSRLRGGIDSFFSRFRLSRRLLRAEISRLYRFADDNLFCIARKAIFRYNPESQLFEKCHTIRRGSRPLNLCRDAEGNIFYGEYFSNLACAPVSIMVSRDNGTTWSEAYRFPEGAVNHIHGIFRDPFTNRLWAFTGDKDSECRAISSDDGFRTVRQEFGGSQQHRICVPLFRKDKIVFATDSPFMPNVVRALSRSGESSADLQTIGNSGIYAADTPQFQLISTAVEPSRVNRSRRASLWISTDTEHWRELLSYPKDPLGCNLFQFGSLQFPEYRGAAPGIIAVTGHALRGLDQSTLLLPISAIPRTSEL